LKGALEENQVKIVFEKEITKEDVIAIKPDIVIAASGSMPVSTAFPGLAGMKVVQANDIIQGKAEAQGKIVVLGNTVVAMETAVWLFDQGKEAAIVSAAGLGGRKGPDDLITFRGLMRRLIQSRLPLYLNAAVLEGSRDSLLIRWGEEILTIPCDTLVLALGVQSRDGLLTELKGIGPEIYAIGDCMSAGNAAQATFSAARLALKL
jgi:2-enoate reductase